jgi:hypothetical protein
VSRIVNVKVNNIRYGKMLENPVQQRIRLEAATAGLQLFRNNVGACTDDTGRLIRYGLGNDSAKVNAVLKSSDLQGWQSIVITPDMVGKRIAQVVSVEVKESNWNHAKKLDAHELAQKAWLDLVIAAGGKAGFATGPADLYRIMGQ